jgi:hypothetical protein
VLEVPELQALLELKEQLVLQELVRLLVEQVQLELLVLLELKVPKELRELERLLVV